MRLVFVNWAFENHGSAQDLYHYTHEARKLGHEVVLYGPAKADSPFTYSLDIDRDDAVVFLFEFTTHLQQGDRLDWLRIVGQVPRHRRVIIDLDGAYNDAISVVGDINHVSVAASRSWIAICDSLSDKIYQPTLHPLRPNVGTFFFHAYNAEWERPLDFRGKEYDMVYVGNNWFRWRGLQRVLHALAAIRNQAGRLAVVGQGWDVQSPWGGPAPIEDAYHTDPEYLRRAGVRVIPPVRFDQVVSWMSKGVFTPVLLRPLFDHLRLVSCRSFETPAANAIPLFAQQPEYVREIYGDKALKLVLGDSPSEQIADVLRRPEHYARTVQDIRLHLREKHSYASRIQQLIRIVESPDRCA
jgi:hypothetical protein